MYNIFCAICIARAERCFRQFVVEGCFVVGVSRETLEDVKTSSQSAVRTGVKDVKGAQSLNAESDCVVVSTLGRSHTELTFVEREQVVAVKSAWHYTGTRIQGL